MTRTNSWHLFKNKDNFFFNYKLKKYKHFSETSMRYDYYRISVKEGLNTDLKTLKLMLGKYDKEVYQMSILSSSNWN